MGIKNLAAVVAALLAVMAIAMALASAPEPRGAEADTPLDAAAVRDIHAGAGLQGQTWARELFGRRYGKHLLAALATESGVTEASA